MFKKILLIAAGIFINVQIANAALINSYDFNGDLTDTLGVGNDLVSSGGTISGGFYSFSSNQGLRLTSALPSTSTYGIELSFSVSDSVVGWNKLIDFEDLASDLGLYINNSKLHFYAINSFGGSISLNQSFIVGFERALDSMNLYIDGVFLGSISDPSGQSVSSINVLNFFEDDNATGQSEAFSGSVDYIRIHNDASTFTSTSVPEPSTILFIAMGAFGLATRKRRSYKS